MKSTTKEQQACIKLCAILGKSATETPAMIRQVFEEESISHIRVFEWHVQTHKKKIVLAGQTVNSAYICDVLQ
jgi:hypothetical protein